MQTLPIAPQKQSTTLPDRRSRRFAQAAPKDRFAGFTDGVSANEGLFAADNFEPVAPVRPFSQFLRGWAVAGEMVAACTRAGKMPTLWMSVWLEAHSLATRSS